MPDIIPTRKGINKTGTIHCHFSSRSADKCNPDILFKEGKIAHAANMANAIASQAIKTDSLKNCAISSDLVAPATLRMPISLARNVDLAVDRFI